MSERDDPRLAVEVGGRTVGAHLDAAIARGGLQFPLLRRVRQALADSLIAVDYGAPNVASHGESRAEGAVVTASRCQRPRRRFATSAGEMTAVK